MGHRFRGIDLDDIEGKSVDFTHMPRLKEFVIPFLPQMALAIVLVIALSLLGLQGPLLMKRAVDVDIPASDVQGLYITVALYAGLQILIAACRFAQTYVMSWTGQQMLYGIRKTVFGHLQDLGLDFYDKLQAGRIMSRVTGDVESINNMISSGVLNILSDIVTLVGIVVVMLRMNVKLALVTFVTVPVLFIVVWVMQTRMIRAYHNVRRRSADVAANLQETISGMKITQAFSREDVNADRFNETNIQNLEANLQAARLNAVFFPLIDVIGAVGSALVVYYGGLRMSWGDVTVTVGTLMAFLNYVNRFFWPIRNLSQVYNQLLQASVSAERVFEVLDTVPNVASKEGAEPLEYIEGHVRFQNVTFGYNPDQPVLHNITLEAKPDETIALVGPTGAGKSSIINLLSRFYDPQEGSILVDGKDIRDVTLESLRENLGIVLQDTFIFSGTIRDNIRYGRLEATDEEVEQAARIVGAHEFIERLPQGYDTEVRERGSRLSVGQRQLLAFARALISDPRILILDEATSSVDAYTELLIQNALKELFRGRTSVVIAHRLSTIRNANRIYVIDQGVIRESGSHDELVAKGGLYATLYQKQFSGDPLRTGGKEAEGEGEAKDAGRLKRHAPRIAPAHES